MAKKYQEFSQLNLPQFEKEILERWTSIRAFENSVELREGAPSFVFYEGPPSANGMPGIHHVISRTLKDLFCRYKTMKGFQVKRKGGWDTHGLPVELGVEKMLGITKEDIGKKISIKDYNEACRKEVLRFKDNWDDLTRKMGYWVDLENPYITFDNNYIETLWWILSELYKKGYLYQSVSIQPYSPAAGTGLSSHELNMPGTYKSVKDTSAVVIFNVIRNEKSEPLFAALETGKKASSNVGFMAWTTTPWTLPANLGLTVGARIEYALVRTFNPYTHEPLNVVLAKDRIPAYFKAEGENGDFDQYNQEDKIIPWKILKTFTGAELEEIRYEQLLPFEANAPENSGGDPFRVLIGDFVTTEDGTGIVHTAPAYGADDYKVGKKYGIGLLNLVDREGKFVDGLGEFSNRYVKNYKDEKDYVDVNVDIAVYLKKSNKAFRVEKYEHNYPHCWRTDKPILYYPLDAWFIRTTALKERMVELNNTINWKPKSTGDGRFGNWLENMVDWNLSRSRFWGTPLPIWRTEDGEEEECIGSVEELVERMKEAEKVLGIKQTVDVNALDLHKPQVDEIVLASPSGKPMKRVPDLVDVWFDSGAMPYAQWHYPFENKEEFQKNFPADFICEGVDQTRGWFYTLHTLAVMLFDSVAFKNVIANGLVLDKNGNKMSKRLGNVINPFETIGEYGADATRWYLITNAAPWDSLKFDISGIKEVQRKFFGTLYNTYQFFALYANVDGFSFKEAYVPVENRPEIDRWILSCLNSLVQKVTRYLDDYEPTNAGRAIDEFVDEQLSNWYVRLCRRRFWKGEYSEDKICAYQTLYECLETVVKLMAPISPFFSDILFLRLNEVTGRNKEASVHHCYFPEANEKVINRALEERMEMAQQLSSMILSLRKKENIKVRQPLQKALIPVRDKSMEEQLKRVEELIKNEVNIKEIEYLSIDNTFIRKKIKPNFSVLGKKIGPKIKAVTKALEGFTQEDIAKFEKDGSYTLLIDSEPLILQISDVEIASEDIPGWTVASKDNLTVALDITVTPELQWEGHARELVNRVQKIRKDNGYELTDKISVKIEEQKELLPAITRFNSYICAEILAESIEFVPELVNGLVVDINDIPLKLNVSKKA
jgi:isoleucyl-tRNA synthetase